MKTHWLVLILLSICAARANADRDIVYAARYYAPPGSHQNSHFHLYRINPDGTGKTQLTFGTTGEADESDPSWSLDGKQITFIAYPPNSDVMRLCRIDADGHNQRVLRTLGEYETLPAPATPGYRLENPDFTVRADISQHTLVALKTGKRTLLTVPEHSFEDDLLLPMPGGGLVYAANNRDSTTHENYLFYRLNAATGELRYLTDGQFLAWSPDGSRFCVAPCRDTAPYEKRKVPLPVDTRESAKERSGDEFRMVWVAPLFIRAASGGKMQQITPRLSYVTGADWRLPPTAKRRG